MKSITTDSVKNSTKNIVTMSNIHKHYDSQQIETHALQGVSITIDQGEFVAISGPCQAIQLRDQFRRKYLLW